MIPFVDDRRNLFVFSPGMQLDNATMATLQAALKQAIQQTYLLESQELAAEPLPSPANRRALLFYESAEGGAGASDNCLKTRMRLPRWRPRPWRSATTTQIPAKTGGPKPEEAWAAAACYDCLLEYGNQKDHQILDRSLAKDFLTSLCRAGKATGQRRLASHCWTTLRTVRLAAGKEVVETSLGQGHLLPDEGQMLISECSTRPDFYYRRSNTGNLHRRSSA